MRSWSSARRDRRPVGDWSLRPRMGLEYPPCPVRFNDRQRPLSIINSGAGDPSKMSDSTEIIVHPGEHQTPSRRRRCADVAGPPPAIISAAGGGAEFAWDEFFKGQLANAHTRKNYAHAVRHFLDWCDHPDRRIPLVRITPGHVGDYLTGLELATPTKKLRLAALRKFFDVLVVRHVVILNPAASVRAERYAVVEGKTPEISAKQARDLLKSVNPLTLVGLRDQAIIAVLIYTAARVGAVAKLTLKSLKHDGTQYALRFSEKGGKSREIPVRHDLEQIPARLHRRGQDHRGTPLSHGCPSDEAAHDQGDERHRHLPDDEAAAQGGRTTRPVLAPLLPRGDGYRPPGTERTPGGRPAPGRAC